MLATRLIASTVVVGLAFGMCVALGQDYPSRPIRIITAGAGGGSDFDARQIAQGISVSLGQPVVVDNRTGVIAAEAVSKSPPDGYTLTVAGGAIWLNTLFRKMPYDVVNDFSPISLIERTVCILVVHPSLPAKSVKELIVLAKAKPGELNWSTSVLGGTSHLAAELFKNMARANIVLVSYKGDAPSITALIGGEVQLTINDAGLITPHVKGGKLRALAVTSAEPSTLAPGLPTVAEGGLPGYEVIGRTGIFAPAKTPGAIVNRLNQDVVRFLSRTDAKERFLSAGVEVVASSPEQLAAAVRSDLNKWDKVIKDANIKID